MDIFARYAYLFFKKSLASSNFFHRKTLIYVDHNGAKKAPDSNHISLRGADTAKIEAGYLARESAKDKEGSEDRASSGDDLEGTIFQFTTRTLTGKELPLVNYKGKRGAFLIVNVASKCGHTKRSYRELRELHKKYEQSGLEIMAFPCNQFKHQEPGTALDIMRFVEGEMEARFPLFEKIDVNGPNTDPLFKFLETNTPGAYGDVNWNFEKWLIDADGKPVKRYRTKQNPLSFESDIKALLDSYDGEVSGRFYP